MSKKKVTLEDLLVAINRVEERLVRVEAMLATLSTLRRETALGEPITEEVMNRAGRVESALGQPIVEKSYVAGGRHGPTPAEREVLKLIERRGEATATVVAEVLRVSRSLATRYLRQLERMGFLTSKLERRNGRTVRLYVLSNTIKGDSS